MISNHQALYSVIVFELKPQLADSILIPILSYRHRDGVGGSKNQMQLSIMVLFCVVIWKFCQCKLVLCNFLGVFWPLLSCFERVLGHSWKFLENFQKFWKIFENFSNFFFNFWNFWKFFDNFGHFEPFLGGPRSFLSMQDTILQGKGWWVQIFGNAT